MPRLEVPHDPEVERSFLATVAAPGAPDVFAEEIGHLRPDFFFVPQYRAIFQAVQCLVEASAEVNLISLKAELERLGLLAKARGVDGIVNTLQAEEVLRPGVLADQIIEAWKSRQIIHATARAQEAARQVGSKPSEVIAALAQRLETLDGAATDDPLQTLDPSTWAESEPPPIEWLIPGLIPKGEPVVLAAKSNAGKSLLSLQLCFSIASGCPLLAYRAPSEPRGVLFVSMEDSPEELHRRAIRCLALFREHPDWNAAAEAALWANFVPLTPSWSSRAPRDLRALEPFLRRKARELARRVPLGLVVLDTFSALCPGDQNDPALAAAAIASAAAISQPFGASSLFLHHVRKASNGPGSKQSMADRLRFDELRGSSALPASARCVVQLEPLTQDEAERLGLDGDRALEGGLVVIATTKHAGGPKGAWTLLEQREAGESGAGFFDPHPDSDRLVASLKSKAAAAKLGLFEEILLSLFDGVTDRKTLGDRHWPQESDAKKADRLKHALSDLRRKYRWVQAHPSLSLTAEGFMKAQKLRGGSDAPKLSDRAKEKASTHAGPAWSDDPTEGTDLPRTGTGGSRGL